MEQLFNAAEVAKTLRLKSNRTVERIRQSGQIGYVKIGKSYFYTQAHINNFITQQSIPAAGITPCPEEENPASKAPGSPELKTVHTGTSLIKQPPSAPVATEVSPHAAQAAVKLTIQELRKSSHNLSFNSKILKKQHLIEH